VIAAMHSADVEIVEIVEDGRVIGVKAVIGIMVGCLLFAVCCLLSGGWSVQ